MIKDIIQILTGFQMSINISYDLRDEDKINRFIPTTSAVNLIEDILFSIADNSTDRARMLVGAYGRGKSHIILIALYLLYVENTKDNEVYNNLMTKIKDYNSELHAYIVELKSNNKKLLPVVINGSSLSLNQSFLSAIYQALKTFGLEDIMPNTHFESVISTINKWEEVYIDTFNSFKDRISKPIDEFILDLKSYSIDAYNEFISIYPELTAGSEFNPFQGFNVIEIYQEVVNKLKKYGYSGVYVVYDEFSKYLESSIAITSNSDIKLLQDFAEASNRSKDKQIHLLLISHKDISNYIDEKVAKEKVDGWRGVSGRFKHVELQNNYFQLYDIISYVIQKEPTAWKEFCNKNNDVFNKLISAYNNSSIFDKEERDNITSIVKGCYPLHPISSFMLPRISEKVAQNERTLFTFLSSNDKNSLLEFITKADGDFPLLTADIIYDYFEPLFKKEPYVSYIHGIYSLASATLSRVDEDSLSAKIIKFIALVYILEQYERITPTADFIVSAFSSDYDTKTIYNTIEELISNKCLVYLKRSNNFLKLKENINVDIKAEISDKISDLKSNTKVTDIINKYNNYKYLYPIKYNEENEIIRYFNVRYTDYKDLNACLNSAETSKNDGSVFIVIPNSADELETIKNTITSITDYNRVIFIIPKAYTDIKEIVYEYEAVINLKDNTEEEVLKNEYDMYIEDLSELLNSYMYSFVSPELGKSLYYYKGSEISISRKSQLSNLLSEIFANVFELTPIINNELINKNNVTSISINSRNRLINGLLENPMQSNLGLHGASQEVSFLRSILVKTGVIENIEKPTINLEPENLNLNNVLQTIKEFILSEPSDFSSLYDKLTNPKYHIGLRLGVIPILLSVVIRCYINDFVLLHNGKEVNISGETLSSLNLHPEEYTFRLDNWNIEKENYIAELEILFDKYIIPQEKVSGSYRYLLNAMNRWYLALPKFIKNMKASQFGLTKTMTGFISKFKNYDINPREFLFNDVVSIFEKDDFDYSIVNCIIETKNTYDNLMTSVISQIASQVKELFKGSEDSSLVSVLKDWYESLSENTRSNLFNNNENELFNIINDSSNDSELIINKLCKYVSSLRLEDWNNDVFDGFIINLSTIKDKIESYDKSSHNDSTNSYKLEFYDNDGNSVIKTFDKVELSKKSKLLYNDITSSIEEMGTSISESEKRQILMQILEEFC